ncbi:hypothetical protein BaRGS_00022477 [Batillaria attramentaria]|uniref:Uncharacterized protein n=1 Tax=Batillaria attramentaria TaxID=370345 RepID=A0ABD0KHC5_9CAEN
MEQEWRVLVYRRKNSETDGRTESMFRSEELFRQRTENMPQMKRGNLKVRNEFCGEKGATLKFVMSSAEKKGQP